MQQLSRPHPTTPNKAFLRYEKTWRIADLDQAIKNVKAELELVSRRDNARRAALLNDLGCHLGQRYFRSDYEFDEKCSLADLREGLAFSEQAVRLTGRDDPLLAIYTSTLADLLLRLWSEDPKSTEDGLRTAVEKSELAVRLLPPDSPDKFLLHVRVAEALSRKGMAYADTSFITRAMHHCRTAERAVAEDHPMRGVVLSKIAEVHNGKFRVDGNQASKAIALDYAVRAFKVTALDSMYRDEIFLVWASLVTR